MSFFVNIYDDVPKLSEYSKKENENIISLNEMARANVDDTGTIFPFNKYKVMVYSNDHNPPHFHICNGQGKDEDWNVAFEIDNPANYKIKKTGGPVTDLRYILKNVNIWLDSKSFYEPLLTNRQAIKFLWKSLHSSKDDTI